MRLIIGIGGIIILFILNACTRVGHDPALYEAGVSHSLATFRKANYENVNYSLFFSLPASSEEAVTGSVALGFTLPKKMPVIIDFRADSVQIKQVLLNGERTDYLFENEHIVIDEKDISAGDILIDIDFIVSDQSLNRREDYLYTLLVPDRARTLFPCFDQPNMKAHYTLSLETPEGWEVIGNSPVDQVSDSSADRKNYRFAPSEPLSTYLFSFVAGRMSKETYDRKGRSISIYHRETDPFKTAQCADIAGEVFDALEWMEKYTDIPYPFAKYDLIIIPGFQFGGMEHTGATLYNDRRMFLNAQSTLQEKLSRSSLIAHETAHMWFGDYVTMDWFDDVWTKEVFANYFAAKMVEPLYPEMNHRLNFIRSYYPPAYSEDRTAGTTPIKQLLDNMSNAGLVYGQIIYNKSPIVMEMLVNKIGEESFHRGIQEYLHTYAYGNATWEDLIRILDQYADSDLTAWSRVWINEKGMPNIHFSFNGDRLMVETSDPWKHGLYWPQTFEVILSGNEGNRIETIDISAPVVSIPIEKGKDLAVLPNIDGRGYGFFSLSSNDAQVCFDLLPTLPGDESKGALLMVLYENLLHKTIDPEWYSKELLKYLQKEENPLLYAMALGHLSACVHSFALPTESIETTLWQIVAHHPVNEYRLQAFRTYCSIARSNEAIQRLYSLWEKAESPEGCQLSENDFISLSYLLAIHLPEKSGQILERQYNRISNPDRLKEYQFIAPSVSADRAVRDSVFDSLLNAENRVVEPWVCTALSNLNHSMRQKESVGYIRPALDVLEEIQRTGDIFFPTNWLRAVLSAHYSVESKEIVEAFFTDHPDYHPMLTNKIKQQSDHLFRHSMPK